VLDGVPDALQEGNIWGSNPYPKHAVANCCLHLANVNEKRFRLLPNYSGSCYFMDKSRLAAAADV